MQEAEGTIMVIRTEEKRKKNKEKDHGHSHGGEKKKKKEKDHGHSHGGEGGGHGHSHEHKKEKKEKKNKSHEHSSLLDDHDHNNHDSHSHEGEKIEKKKQMNVNIYAMLIHYFGDALSSVLVLVAGILMKYVHHTDGKTSWTQYVDPVASILIVFIMLWSTIPLLIRCSKILMQRVPSDIELGKIREELLRVPGVMGVHELHVWPLVEEMIICSVHITCEEGTDFNSISNTFKQIFHEHGIHSTSIQPEFVPIHHPATEFCAQNCVEDCEEDWCCRKSAAIAERAKSPPPPHHNHELL